MHEPGKSDRPVVPEKSAKTDYWDFHRKWVEWMKGRGLAKENGEDDANAALSQAGPAKQVDRTQSRLGNPGNAGTPEDLPSALDRVRQVACRDKQLKFTSLWHHVYVDRLREAYRALKHDASAGIDGQTWQAYGQELESNLLRVPPQAQRPHGAGCIGGGDLHEEVELCARCGHPRVL